MLALIFPFEGEGGKREGYKDIERLREGKRLSMESSRIQREGVGGVEEAGDENFF